MKAIFYLEWPAESGYAQDDRPRPSTRVSQGTAHNPATKAQHHGSSVQYITVQYGTGILEQMWGHLTTLHFPRCGV
jgi:hypothetical protein